MQSKRLIGLLLIFLFSTCNEAFSLSLYGNIYGSYGKVIENNISYTTLNENYNFMFKNKGSYNIKYDHSNSIGISLGIDMTPLIPFRIELSPILERLYLDKKSSDNIPSLNIDYQELKGIMTSVYFTPIFSWFLANPYLMFGLGTATTTIDKINNNATLLSYGLGMFFSITTNMQIEIGYRAINGINIDKIIIASDQNKKIKLSIPYNTQSIKIGLLFFI